MKNLIAAAAFFALGITNSATAADQSTPPAQPSAATSTQSFDQQMSQMQQHMKLMQDQMRKIEAAKDDAEKQKLLAEHWESMQKGMQMMHGMSQSGMMGPMMPGMTSEQMAQRQHMMGQYMGMQQMMMQHMWGHQSCMMGHHDMMNMWQ